MSGSFTAEQQLLADSAARFFAREWSYERRREALAGPVERPGRLWHAMAKLGWPGIGIAPEDGGSGGGAIEIMILMEALGRAMAPSPFLSTAVIGAHLVSGAADGERRRALLEGILSGELTLALAAYETEARYDLDRVAMTARREGDGYILSGHKSVVLDGAAADLLIVSARMGETTRGGMALFIVPVAAAGVSRRGFRTYDGRAAADVRLDNVCVDGNALLSGPGNLAFEQLLVAVDRGIAAICSEAVGVIGAALAMTTDYLKTRRQFGGLLGRRQVLQHRLVDVLVAAEEARSLTLAATLHLDAPFAVRRRFVSAAKVQVGKAGNAVAQDCVQMHGALGISDEHPVSHCFRALVAIDALFGDADHHLGCIAADL